MKYSVPYLPIRTASAILDNKHTPHSDHEKLPVTLLVVPAFQYNAVAQDFLTADLDQENSVAPPESFRC